MLATLLGFCEVVQSQSQEWYLLGLGSLLQDEKKFTCGINGAPFHAFYFKPLINSSLRGCLYDTGATFAPERVHSGSLSWLYICLHDTTTKCYACESPPGVSSPRFSHRGENFTPVRNLATVSCKRETTTHFGVKSVCQ